VQVDASGEKILPCPCLARDQDRRVSSSNQIADIQDTNDRRGTSQQSTAPASRIDFVIRIVQIFRVPSRVEHVVTGGRTAHAARRWNVGTGGSETIAQQVGEGEKEDHERGLEHEILPACANWGRWVSQHSEREREVPETAASLEFAYGGAGTSDAGF
jgi:hypothetical protein